jgi:hypothetical protein
MGNELPQLIVADAAAWADLARRTSRRSDRGVAYPRQEGHDRADQPHVDQALDESLCLGWVDGQARRRNEST